MPDIGVSLYDLKCGSLSIPIELSYHASGLRVNEISSWVGLGWSLSAGGVVSRTIRGRPDNSVNGNGYFSSSINKFFNGNDPKSTSQITCASLGFIDMEKLAQGCYDTQPDIWHFSGPGLQGKFM